MLRVGHILYGFCNGKFGRVSYDNKRIEGIGADWVVARGEDGIAVFARDCPEDLLEYLIQ